MPDLQAPQPELPERPASTRRLPELRSSAPRLRASRPPRSRLRIWAAGSLAAHLFALLVMIFVHVVSPPPPPAEEPSFGMMFEPSNTSTKGAPNPSQYTSTPQGEKSPEMRPTPQAQPSPPPTPAPAPPQQQQAEVNLLPPEYQQAQPPPPPQQQAESVPQEQRQKQENKQAKQSRQRQAPSRNNPFANPMLYSFAPQARQGPSGGIRSSRSLDLSAGPVVSGGRLQDAVAHVIGPGGRGDYMEALSEFVELHKYYPPSSARNGEEGQSVIRVTIERDGTVKNLRLLSSSGSSMLDAAWEAVFRDNKLPPFPDDLPGNQQTFTLSLNYHLLYR